MKKITLFTLLCFIVFAFLLTGVNAAQKSICVNKSCKSIPGLTMTQVTITDDQTRVEFEWQNTEECCAISIYAPGNASAFVIKDKRSSRTYTLKGAEGISYYPEKVSIKEGEVKKFTLVFDKMPYPYLNALSEVAELIVTADYR